MQTQNISFCDRIGLNIKSNDVKKRIIDELEEIRIVEKHHEVFNEQKHDRRLRKVPHLLSIKSNGNPYYMYFTKINFTNTIVMIDKKIQMGYEYPRMIIIRMMFHDRGLFDNTLLEGEMIKDKSSEWLYLISDIHVFKNKSVRDFDLIKRLNLINNLLEDHFVPSCNDLFSVQVKKYVPLTESEYFHNDFMTSLNYTCRGLYFKPLYSKFKDILFNFDNSLVNRNLKPKLKSKYNFVTNDAMKMEADKVVQIEAITPPKDTILKENAVFQVQKTEIPDLFKLYDETNKYIGNACVDSLRTSKMLTMYFQNMTMLEKAKFECVRTKNKHLSTTWIPLKPC